MNMVIINSSKPTIEQLEIYRLEEANQIILPDAYKKFLLEYNGGNPTPSCFHYQHADPYYGQGEAMIDYFFYVGPDESDFRCLTYQIRTNGSYIQAGFFPIGYGGSETIYIGVGENNVGKIYVKIHAIHPEDGNIVLVSENFSSFLNNLYDCLTDAANFRH